MELSKIEDLTQDESRRGLRPQHFQYHRRLIQMLRDRAPYLLPLVMMEVRADLAMRRKLFPKAKA
jgi:hypothetical protein